MAHYVKPEEKGREKIDTANTHHMILALEQSPSCTHVSHDMPRSERQTCIRSGDDTKDMRLNNDLSMKLLTVDVNLIIKDGTSTRKAWDTVDRVQLPWSSGCW